MRAVKDFFERLGRRNNRVRNIYLYFLKYGEETRVDARCSVELEEITPENYKYAAELKDEELQNHFRNNLDLGDFGLLIKVDNELVGYIWSRIINSKRSTDEFYKTDKDAAMFHSCTIKEAYRGKNIYPYTLYNLVQRVYKKYCVTNFLGCIESTNIPSQKGIAKVGFKKIDQHRFIYILGKVINRRTLRYKDTDG